MKIFITGGLGYLGGRLAHFFVSGTKQDILLGSRKQVVSLPWLSGVKTVQTRWDSMECLQELCSGQDAVIHLAGMNAQDCAKNPVEAIRVNALNTASLLQAATSQGVRRFVYLSTAHVYGNPLTGQISEQTCPMPLHPYASSHRAGEDIIRTAHQQQSIEGVVIRLTNAFGFPMHRDVDCWMLLANDLCRQAILTHKISLRTSGLQRRNFIGLGDVCRAIGHLLELSSNDLGDGLFNVGSDWNPTVLEMAKLIAERVQAITGKIPEVTHPPAGKNEKSEVLDYKIHKLCNSGFKLYQDDLINRELDGLIQFCREHF